MENKNSNTSFLFYLIALPIIFFTLLYTGIVRRFFYALPIAVTKLLGRVSFTRVLSLTITIWLLLYSQLLPVPFTVFLQRFESLLEHSILRGNASDYIRGAELSTMPNAFEELAIQPVNVWHIELIFPVPMVEFLVFFGLFLGATFLSILVDKIVSR
ncbi:hypothetical protein [Vibrio vulnificus]|uniref:hypothetical protein n=1 Tax=Vibrio vulnificus TaxID=672 RepID=UPI001A1D3E9C|nr:hypothetical protein [Vibrio vulnificus]EHD1698128.1 hypothetical protein [Vibrio vulnificus]EKZ9225857.1 hypothetical protein [Vibrio vulnificus]ELC9582699.1 hypothetical protein [Vibrio vulnificus]MCU8149764.1 hypothetical protein [Vibrio vulnificus]